MDYTRELDREKSHSDHMATMAQYWMERAQKAERDLFERTAMLVEGAGGFIEVHHAVLQRLPEISLRMQERLDNMSIEFCTHPSPPDEKL